MKANGKENSPLSAEAEKRFKDRTTKTDIAGVVLFYWMSSIATVFMNKHLLSSSVFRGIPFLISAFQLEIALVLFVLVGCVDRRKAVVLRKKRLVQLLPLCAVYVGMLGTNNICLKNVDITLYQITRSLTIIFQLLFDVFLQKRATSGVSVFACIVVFVGFVMSVFIETELSVFGVAMGVLSSVFTSVYCVLVKKSLPAAGDNELVLLHHTSFLGGLLLFCVSALIGEARSVTKEFLEPREIGKMVFSGILGCLVSFSIFLQIKKTSPLASTISGTAKGCVQSILAVVLFQRQITFLNCVGIVVSLSGSTLYSFSRMREANKAESKGKSLSDVGRARENGGRGSEDKQEDRC
ncbi:MAG: triose phosphate transporter [Amphiamblys sp. WSBS2006]|nr:MAG: triose phosphate transporter [Amphiamblys sp. WSBS2006]